LGGHALGRWLFAGKPQADNAGSRVWTPRWTITLLSLVVLLFVAGIAAVGIAHQVAWLATSPEPIVTNRLGDAAGRPHASNNLHHFAIAAHDFHDKEKHLPQGATFDPHGRALHGWFTHLLPYLEHDAVYQQIDLKLPWSDPKNAAAFATPIRMFTIPGVAEEK